MDFSRRRTRSKRSGRAGSTPPRADLDQLFPGADSERMDVARQDIEGMVGDFRERYHGKVSGLSGRELARAIDSYEKIESRKELIAGYVSLLEASDAQTYVLTAPIRGWIGRVETVMSFFCNELGDMKEIDLMPRMAEPALARHASWIAGVRSLSAHSVSSEVAAYYQEHAAASRAGWMRLYRETLGGMTFSVDGREETLDVFESRLYSADPQKKAQARAVAAASLKANAPRMAFILNTLIADKQVADVKRGFTRDDQEANLLNRLDDGIVDALTRAVTASYPRLSHRFFNLERLAAEKTPVQPGESSASDDFNAAAGEAEDEKIGWDQAKGFVLRSFNRFMPRFSRIAKGFFDNGYIDAEPRAGKQPSAFTQSCGRLGHPYIFMHYGGNMADVVTLAHELGHGIHDRLAERANRTPNTDIPTALAETASTFAEALVFDELLRREKDIDQRVSIQQYRLENMIEAVHREVSYYDFERRVHEARKAGELTAEEISDIWIDTRRDYLGPAATLDNFDRYEWMTVTHFFESPFYVYSYAAAQLVVAVLFDECRKDSDDRQFRSKYVAMLESGATRNLDELMRDFGFDIRDPDFWKRGLAVMENQLDKIENAIGPEKPHPDHCRDDVHAPPPGPSFRRRSPGFKR